MTNSAAVSGNISIRGIGTVGNNRSFEGAVGVFVDGVYRSRAGQAVQNWLDIGSVQVLRGPQGTLFGKNNSAGAVLISSIKPNTSALGGTYELTYGNYQQMLARGAINVPLTDSLAVRVAALWTNEGYIKNPTTGVDYNDHLARAVKVQGLWTPTDDFSLRLIADWSRSQENCCYGSVDVQNGFTDAVITPLASALGLRHPPASSWKDYKAELNGTTDEAIEDRGVALIADWKAGPGNLRSTTAYRWWNLGQRNMDVDFTAADIIHFNEFFKSQGFSQEFVYTGQATPLGRPADYTFGAYYARETVADRRELFWGLQAAAYWAAFVPPTLGEALPGLWASEIMPGRSKSLGVFTHWTVSATDKLKLIGGVRYSEESKTGAFRNTLFRGNFPPAAPPYPIFYLFGVMPGPAFAASHKDKEFSATVGLQYQFSSDAMAYLTYSHGFKAGGVNLDTNAAGLVVNNPAVIPLSGVPAAPLDPTYRPEFIDGIETGLKLDYMAGRARTNVAVFYDRIKDLQVAQFLGLQYAIINAPKATTYGAEIENTFRVSSAVTLEAAATWLPKAKFGQAAILGFLSGRDFAHAPKLAATASISLDQPLASDLNLTGRAGLQYSSSIYTVAANNFQQGDLGLVDLAVGIRSPGRGWRLEAWCQNCTDKRYATQHFNTPLQNIAPPFDVNAYVGAPRQYGVTLRSQF